jgi:4'-phosphopantetheinyl transferase EntD
LGERDSSGGGRTALQDAVGPLLRASGVHLGWAVAHEAAAGEPGRSLRAEEFRLGRCAAAQALRAVGVEEVSVPSDAVGRPVWPVGVTGSISHSRAVAVAAVTTSPASLGLGVDLEDLPLDLGAPESELICGPDELARLAAAPADAVGWVFGAKEALFKALPPAWQASFEAQNAVVLWSRVGHPVAAVYEDGQRTARTALAGGRTAGLQLVLAVATDISATPGGRDRACGDAPR